MAKHRCTQCERYVCDNPRCQLDDSNHCGTCRYQQAITPQVTTEPDSDHCKGIDAAFASILAKRRRQEEERTPRSATLNNNTNTTTEATPTSRPAPIAPWDDENAPIDFPPDDDPQMEGPALENSNSTAPYRRQSNAIRARIIRHNRMARAARKHLIERDKKRAINLLASPNNAVPASAPCSGIGSGHRPFAVGPILFCKICGATKSRSQGKRLARPCRGWAPPGTLATTRARLQGRNYAFYKDLTSPQTVVNPVVTPASDDVRTLPLVPSPPPAPPPIRLTRTSVVNAHLPRNHHRTTQVPAESVYSCRDDSDNLLPKAKRCRIRGKQAPGSTQLGS